jgi:2-polyprenyl-6-methoxyphenol hydroxylase-like FAD-dependent oxidoreductase
VAIEGAHQLAWSLSQHSHVPAALMAYEEALRPRVDACRTITAFTKMIAALPEVSPGVSRGWVAATSGRELSQVASDRGQKKRKMMRKSLLPAVTGEASTTRC